MFTFSLLLTRFDWRLTYINLKNGSEESNTIGDKDSDIVWIPNLIFENSPTGVYIQNHALSSLSVKAKDEPKSKFDFDFQEFEEFAGISNPLSFKSSYELKLGCEFQLVYYPFDYQECLITVLISKLFKYWPLCLLHCFIFPHFYLFKKYLN